MVSNRALKLFLTCFVVYSFFSMWTSWDEESVYALVRSIYEGSFNIDKYANFTGTRYEFNGHFYSAYEINAGLIPLPLYTLGNIFFPEAQDGLKYLSDGDVLIYESPTSNQILKFLLTVGTSVLFSCLLVVSFYKFVRYFEPDEKSRLFAALTLAFASPLFTFARSFLVDATVIFFLTISFILLFKGKREKEDFKLLFISGMFFGFSMGIALYVVVLILPYLFYLSPLSKKHILFVSGIIVGYLPTLIASWYTFGLPYSVPIDHRVWTELPPLRNLPYFPHWSIPLRVLFYPLRGLFFYFPVFLLSAIGLLDMWKSNYKIETLFIFFLLLLISNLSAFHFQWWGGFVFGPQYLLQTIPFLSIPLIYQIKKRFKVFLPLFIISVFVSLLGLQYYEPGVYKIDEDYIRKMKNLRPIGNPLFFHYLPLFLINGPRSILLENLLIERRIDIRITHHSAGLTPPILKKTEILLFSLPSSGFITLRIPFLSVVLVSIAVFLIWKKEILKRLNLNSRQALLIIFGLFMLFVLSFIRITHFLYGENWYAPEWHDGKVDTSRWMSQNATLFLFNKHNKTKKIILAFHVQTFNKPRDLGIYLNDELIGVYRIEGEKKVFQEITLRPGTNKLLFHSFEGCERSFNDLRCISFKIGDIQLWET